MRGEMESNFSFLRKIISKTKIFKSGKNYSKTLTNKSEKLQLRSIKIGSETKYFRIPE